MHFLETEQLTVRHLQPDDLDTFHAITSDPSVTKYMGDGEPLSRELTEKWIAVSRRNYATKGYGCSAVIEKTSGDFIGFCGLIHPPEAPERVEIIYAFKPSAWGKGYASELIRPMLAYGLREFGMPRIVATIHPDNQTSIHVAEKAGMRFEKIETDDEGIPTTFYVIEATSQ